MSKGERIVAAFEKHGLSDTPVTILPKNETEWQKVITKAAVTMGWEWLHIGRVGKYRANGAKGTLGTGWPDLFLIRPGRMIFVELKADDGTDLTREQKLVMAALSNAGAEVYVWRPRDFAQAMHVLNGGA